MRQAGRRLVRLASALYASKAYLEERSDLEDLASHSWVAWENGMEHIPAARWMRENVPGARVACRVSTGTALRAAVHDGLGIAHLLCFLAEDDTALCQVRPPDPELETGLWLLTHEDLAATGRVRVFLDFVANAIGRERSRLSAAGAS